MDLISTIILSKLSRNKDSTAYFLTVVMYQISVPKILFSIQIRILMVMTVCKLYVCFCVLNLCLSAVKKYPISDLQQWTLLHFCCQNLRNIYFVFQNDGAV